MPRDQDFDRNPLFAIMILFLVFLGAWSLACARSSPVEHELIAARRGPCPIGWFATTGEHRNCTCPDGQDKHQVGMFEMFDECVPPPAPARDEPRVDIECNDPPASCAYEGRISSGSVSEVSCGTLVCPDPICSIHCDEPPGNCRYVGQVASGPCGKVDCGKLLCEDHPRCRDGERRIEPCWSGGVRGKARHTCVDGRWHADPCEFAADAEPIAFEPVAAELAGRAL